MLQALLVEDTYIPGALVVVKAMHRQYAYAGQREARALRFLHSRSPLGAAPGIVRLLDVFMLGPHFCLVTERLYPRLLDWIADSAQQPQQAALQALRKLAYQLLVSLCFLHQQGVVHADLKPDNILFTSPHGSPGMGVRLVDFGGSFSLTETDTRRLLCEVQTLHYRAPEAVLGLPYGTPIDLWSVGVLIAEAALKQPLLPCRTPAEALQAMTDILGPLPPTMLTLSPLAQQLGLNGIGGGSSGAAAPGSSTAKASVVATTPEAARPGAGVGGQPVATSASLHALRALDPALGDLVGRLLCYDPAQRGTEAQALLHPFFDPLLPLRTLLPSLHAACPQQSAAAAANAAPAGTDAAAAAAAGVAAGVGRAGVLAVSVPQVAANLAQGQRAAAAGAVEMPGLGMEQPALGGLATDPIRPQQEEQQEEELQAPPAQEQQQTRQLRLAMSPEWPGGAVHAVPAVLLHVPGSPAAGVPLDHGIPEAWARRVSVAGECANCSARLDESGGGAQDDWRAGSGSRGPAPWMSRETQQQPSKRRRSSPQQQQQQKLQQQPQQHQQQQQQHEQTAADHATGAPGLLPGGILPLAASATRAAAVPAAALSPALPQGAPGREPSAAAAAPPPVAVGRASSAAASAGLAEAAAPPLPAVAAAIVGHGGAAPPPSKPPEAVEPRESGSLTQGPQQLLQQSPPLAPSAAPPDKEAAAAAASPQATPGARKRKQAEPQQLSWPADVEGPAGQLPDLQQAERNLLVCGGAGLMPATRAGAAAAAAGQLCAEQQGARAAAVDPGAVGSKEGGKAAAKQSSRREAEVRQSRQSRPRQTRPLREVLGLDLVPDSRAEQKGGLLKGDKGAGRGAAAAVAPAPAPECTAVPARQPGLSAVGGHAAMLGSRLARPADPPANALAVGKVNINHQERQQRQWQHVKVKIEGEEQQRTKRQKSQSREPPQPHPGDVLRRQHAPQSATPGRSAGQRQPVQPATHAGVAVKQEPTETPLQPPPGAMPPTNNQRGFPLHDRHATGLVPDPPAMQAQQQQPAKLADGRAAQVERPEGPVSAGLPGQGMVPGTGSRRRRQQQAQVQQTQQQQQLGTPPGAPAGMAGEPAINLAQKPPTTAGVVPSAQFPDSHNGAAAAAAKLVQSAASPSKGPGVAQAGEAAGRSAVGMGPDGYACKASVGLLPSQAAAGSVRAAASTPGQKHAGNSRGGEAGPPANATQADRRVQGRRCSIKSENAEAAVARKTFKGRISWDFRVPYIDEYQEGHFKYTYKVWQDQETGRQKIVRDDIEEVLILVPSNQMYQVFPAYDKSTCWLSEVHGGTGPTLVAPRRDSSGSSSSSVGMQAEQPGQQRRRRQAERQHGLNEQQAGGGENALQQRWRRELSASGGEGQRSFSSGYQFEFERNPDKYLTFVLPDLSERRWEYKGKHLTANREGQEVAARMWEWDMSEGNMTMKYQFYASQDGVPLKLWMLGINLLSGGHKDEYVMEYYDYKPGEIPDDTFAAPDMECVDPLPDNSLPASRSSLLASFRRTLPNVHHGDARYDRFAHAHGRRHHTSEEYEARRQVYHENMRFIQDWNAAPGRHRVALNHFGDWSREEFEAVIMPATSRETAPAAPGDTPKAHRLHQTTLPPHMLPKQLSWKGTGADSPVKDQAACGSCWSFSTVAAFETAYFRLTGKQQLFSEQQLIDCAWEVNNHGCYGGDQGRAFDWVFQHGGLARNEDYPYRGVNDFCKKDLSEIKFQGHTVVVEGGELAVMDALITKGPMTVSVDASHDAFRFYAGGIFSLPECHMAPKELDHAVILSGYGTTEDGTDFWLVKNIWSPYWGEDGYIRIARKPNDCGIASEPIYVDMTLVD
ncbi:hypothetical protein N2152v2_005651 [Parachlorella kessleri]